eukprot:7937632-Alexandrium_andersonii.AAC.1
MKAKTAIAELPAETEAPAAPPAPPGRRQEALEDFEQLDSIVLQAGSDPCLSLIHISEPTRLALI